MDDLDLDEIEALTDNATQGRWKWRDCNELRTLHDKGKHRYGALVLRVQDDVNDVSQISEEDADFIAALDPPTVKALIARVRRAEADRAYWRERFAEEDDE